MTYIAYKASKAPSLLVKTVGHKPQNYSPQSNPHHPHLLRVCPYEIFVDNCKEKPYIVGVARYCPHNQLNESKTMTHKINITKSRAGHYTVSVRDAQGFRVYIRDMVSTLQQARRYAFEYMDTVNAKRA